MLTKSATCLPDKASLILFAPAQSTKSDGPTTGEPSTTRLAAGSYQWTPKGSPTILAALGPPMNGNLVCRLAAEFEASNITCSGLPKLATTLFTISSPI